LKANRRPTKKKSDRPSMKELAERISAHLWRFERDRNGINKPDPVYKTTPYFCAQATWRSGARVAVRYVSYQLTSYLTRDEAEDYLAGLDGGFVGRHYEWQRSKEMPK
jgi:hypothetical protein